MVSCQGFQNDERHTQCLEPVESGLDKLMFFKLSRRFTRTLHIL